MRAEKGGVSAEFTFNRVSNAKLCKANVVPGPELFLGPGEPPLRHDREFAAKRTLNTDAATVSATVNSDGASF